jgi:segregation and condensation protein B
MSEHKADPAAGIPDLELAQPQQAEDERWHTLERVLEALLLASDQPLSIEQLHRLLGNELGVAKKDLRTGLERLEASLAGRAAELREVASGFRIQVRSDYAEWVSKLWQEKPPRLSRALLETLALVCYRQPITRGEIEEVRGVALSPNIIRTLLERNWIREVGVKEVPGRPSLFGTTQQLLDDLSLKSLDDLPSLPEIKDPQQLEAALQRLGEQVHEVSHVADAPGEAVGEPQGGDDSAADGETPPSASTVH